MWGRRHKPGRGSDHEGTAAAADAGNVDAMYQLGGLCSEESDADGAERWWLQAAERGHVGAMRQLARFYSVLDPPYPAGTRRWLKRAALAGDSAAMTTLGNLLEVYGGPADLSRARTWYERAAAAGEPNAVFRLGALAALSDPPDRAAARRWWEQAAQDGHAGAMISLADFFEESQPPDLEAAQLWTQRAAHAGHAGAMFRLGSVAVAVAALKPGQLAIAMDWYERAADAGHAGAMFALGTIYEQLVEAPNLEMARHWWRCAADAGHSAAQERLDSIGATWTVPGGWGLQPPDRGDVEAMSDWFGRHAGDVDHAAAATDASMDQLIAAVNSGNMLSLPEIYDAVAEQISGVLVAAVPTPDADLTEAVRGVTESGQRLQVILKSLSDRPTSRQLEPLQGALTDIAATFGRLMSIYQRDREIVETSLRS